MKIDWAKLYPFKENKVIEFKTRLKKLKKVLKFVMLMPKYLKMSVKK